LNRDCFGGGTLVNDLRWAGSYGVQADFVAMSHCSVEIIKTSDIEVIALAVILTLDYIELLVALVGNTGEVRVLPSQVQNSKSS
jgi:hypothetical protein